MKKYILSGFVLFVLLSFSYTQNIEKLGEITSLTSYQRMNRIIPSDTYVDEINNFLYCRSDKGQSQSIYNLNKISEEQKKKDYFAKTTTETFIILSNFEIHFSEIAFEIKKENEVIVNGPLAMGISFILKKGSGYIVYYVDKTGKPGAVDTVGKIYTNKEAMEYLKEYDSEKYAQSLKRAEELGLKQKFLNSEVLVWGRTYYSTIKNMEKVYGEIPYIRTSDLIQYDLKGYGYEFQDYLKGSEICIVSPEGKRLTTFSISEPSTIYSTYTWEQDRSSSWYVGFGGNIYYYIAGEEYTEVFRIRRTWGDPDFYAMAINGYTEDEYGKYVDEVLLTLSKSDLRLLRNTIFALYGVHFKSDDLSRHFDKQVWYTDEGKTSTEIKLPEHRQKLLELIQELEKNK